MISFRQVACTLGLCVFRSWTLSSYFRSFSYFYTCCNYWIWIFHYKLLYTNIKYLSFFFNFTNIISNFVRNISGVTSFRRETIRHIRHFDDHHLDATTFRCATIRYIFFLICFISKIVYNCFWKSGDEYYFNWIFEHKIQICFFTLVRWFGVEYKIMGHQDDILTILNLRYKYDNREHLVLCLWRE